jgi:hypothetical protein
MPHRREEGAEEEPIFGAVSIQECMTYFVLTKMHRTPKNYSPQTNAHESQLLSTKRVSLAWDFSSKISQPFQPSRTVDLSDDLYLFYVMFVRVSGSIIASLSVPNSATLVHVYLALLVPLL